MYIYVYMYICIYRASWGKKNLHLSRVQRTSGHLFGIHQPELRFRENLRLFCSMFGRPPAGWDEEIPKMWKNKIHVPVTTNQM